MEMPWDSPTPFADEGGAVLWLDPRKGPNPVEPTGRNNAHFLMLIFAGWIDRHQQDMIKFLHEENRALCE